MSSRRQFLSRAFATLVAAPLVRLGWKKKPTQPGVSIRMIRAYDPVSNAFVTRVDALYGFGVMRPEYACTVKG